MEKLNHKNDIEIKLLSNRRFMYANRKSSIVITAEHNATEITVLFPDEYEEYSKRVDFVNSHGTEWTEGLYTPEFKKYKGGFNKTRFHFTLPTEVTTEGELKMQFLAYKPDKSMTTVPFEVVPIDILNGVLAFKKSARSNPDLLILSANQSTEALFNSQRAVAKSEKAERVSEKSERQSKTAVKTADATAAGLETEILRAMQAETDITAALIAESDRAKLAEALLAGNLSAEIERAIQAESAVTAALNAETARATEAENVIAADLAAETQRATAAETDLQSQVTAEQARAKAAENDLTNSLLLEAAARIQDDIENAAAIAAESERAQTAEQINADSIQAEALRAQGAEADLQTNISMEQARAINIENSLLTGLTNESSRSMQAEAAISADLNAETARAIIAEQINANAIQAETARAVDAETALGIRIDSEIPAAVKDAKDYADQVAQQVRIDGTIYKGTVDESDLPVSGNENGDLYWISDFNITEPGHSGSAIFNGKTNTWDFNIDRYKHQDNDTIVARESDGALKVTDTDEINILPDTTDFGASVQLGYKAMTRSLIRKTRGLFQKSNENAAAVSAEVIRAQTAEGGLSSAIDAEVIRAKAAEQANANAILTESQRAEGAENSLSERIAAEEARAQTAENTLLSKITAEEARAKTAESGLSSRITSEESRAMAAEQANANAITAETARAQSAESGLWSGIATEETRAKAAEQANKNEIDAEVSRALGAEAALKQNIIDSVQGAQSDWSVEDEASVKHIKNKPSSLPASDVYPWAKAASKPTYTASEVGAEPAFTKNGAFNKSFGTTQGTVCEGNDSRLSNSRPASDVPAWAKAASKPTYTASEVGAEPAFTKNGAFNKSFGTTQGTVCEGNDSRLSNSRPASDVPAWAKTASKPSYAFSEITGAVSPMQLPTAGNAAGTKGAVYQGDNIAISADGKISAANNGVFDVVIRTQAEFEALYNSANWLGAKSVAFIGDGGTLEFTRASTGLLIPNTVKQIAGFNGAKISITNLVFNATTNGGGLWYYTAPTTSDYSISNLTVKVTGSLSTAGACFFRCVNLTNCNGIAPDKSFSYCTNLVNCACSSTGSGMGGFDYCTQLINCNHTGLASGFYNCTQLINCNHTGTGFEVYGFNTCVQLTNCTGSKCSYIFNNCKYINGCKSGAIAPTRDVWDGTNTFRDDQSCQLT